MTDPNIYPQLAEFRRQLERLQSQEAKKITPTDLPSTVAYTDAANTFTANQTIDGSGGTNQLSLNRIDGVSVNQIRWSTGGSQRWLARTSETESGANAGSIWQLLAYDDTGSFLWRPFWITRNTQRIGIGTVTPSAMLDVNGTLSASGLSTLNGIRNGDTTTTPTGGIYVARRETAATASQLSVIDLRLQSTGTPAAGFGMFQIHRLQSTTTVDREAAAIRSFWLVPTDAVRTSIIAFSAWDWAGEREGLRLGANGTQPTFGALGAAAIPRQTVPAAATDAATTQALVNALRTAFIAFGFLN